MWWGEIVPEKSGRWNSGRSGGRQAYYVEGGDVRIPSKEFVLPSSLWSTFFGPKITEIGFIDLSPRPQTLRIADGIYSSDNLHWIVDLEIQLNAIDNPKSLARIPVERDSVLETVQIVLRNMLAQMFATLDHGSAQTFTNQNPEGIVSQAGSQIEQRTPYQLLSISIKNVMPADKSALEIVEKKRRAAISEEARAAEQRGKLQVIADEAAITKIKTTAERERNKADQEHQQEIERMQAEHEKEMEAQRASFANDQRLADLQFRALEYVTIAKAQSEATEIGERRLIAHQNEVDKQNFARLLNASKLPKDVRTVLSLGVDGALNIAEIEKQIEIAKASSNQKVLDGILKFAISGAVVSGQLNTLTAMMKKQNLLPANYAITFGSPLGADQASDGEAGESAPSPSTDTEE